MSSSTPLIVTHPCTLFRDGLREIFTSSRFQPVHIFPSLSQDAAGYLQSATICVWLVGVERYNSTTNALVQRMVTTNQGVKPVILASSQTANDIVSALEAGACGFLSEDMPGELLIKSLELILLGQTVVHPHLSCLTSPQSNQIRSTGETQTNGGFKADAPRQLLSSALGFSIGGSRLLSERQADNVPETLSPREMLILRALIDGASNKLIARKFLITESTVKVHMKAILRKLRLQNRTQAAIWARNHIGELVSCGG